jgi:hypothetical protein
MIKRVLFAALVVAAPVCLVSAQDAKVSVHMMGIGGMSCAHWRSTQEHLIEGAVSCCRFSGRDSITLLQQAIKHRRKSTWRR